MNSTQGSMVCYMGGFSWTVRNGLLEEGEDREFHKPFTKITTIAINVGKLGNFYMEFYKMVHFKNCVRVNTSFQDLFKVHKYLLLSFFYRLRNKGWIDLPKAITN